MDSLDGTSWDVVIAGTGIQESLLALALSRSGKSILQVDHSGVYGGAEAAFSLQEAEEWAEAHKGGNDESNIFRNASIARNAERASPPQLSFPRAYSLTLSPHIVYTQSAILASIVSSRIESQLEFLAFGSWWVDSGNADAKDGASKTRRLVRVPDGREDVFADSRIDLTAKRALMKFLRFISHFEDQPEAWKDYERAPFPEFLTAKFKLPDSVQQPLIALSLSTQSATQTTTGFALPRIARHLRSIGRLGPGFGAVIPKWGGLAEIAQVCCRAGAVGGAVYVLGNGVRHVSDDRSAITIHQEENPPQLRLELTSGDKVSSRWLVCSQDNVPQERRHANPVSNEQACNEITSRAIFIVSSPLQSLFSKLADEGPQPAGTMIVFPNLIPAEESASGSETPPVHLIIHSSDTGECPVGQCVLYMSVAEIGVRGQSLIDKALEIFLSDVQEDSTPAILWQMNYEQMGPQADAAEQFAEDGVLSFSPIPLDPAFDDVLLERVRFVWKRVLGSEAEDFMDFPQREGIGEDDEA